MKVNRLTLKGLIILFFCFMAIDMGAQRKMEKLGRGVVAINKGGGIVYVSWRLLASDPEDVSFNLYRSIGGGAAVKLNGSPITVTTDFTDNTASTTQTNGYFVKPVINSVEQTASTTYTLAAGSVAKSYISLPLQPLTDYSVNHVYVGDLNGDGEYDYVVKRFPFDAVNNVMIEAYSNSGTFLWRVDLGPNVEQGPATHNPFVLVHDFDCDGKAEVLVRTGEGSVFADGFKIPDMNGDGITDYRTLPAISLGYMVLGDNCPEFISMINGTTGDEITRTDNIDRGAKANWYTLWGDDYGHRMNMNHVGVAYLDGIHPSIVSSRGDGGVMDIEAYDYKNGTITSRWTWSARTNAALPVGKTWKQFHTDWVNGGAVHSGMPAGYHWADFHNLRVVDLDGDGKDEISWGVNAMDDNGIPLYYAKNDVGHGDRFVIADIDPDRPGLETYAIQQSGSVLAVLYDAKTGERLKTWSTANPFDVGRGDVGDIDPRYKGLEMWSYAHPGVLDAKGNQISTGIPHPALSVWWDGDLQRENLDAAGNEGYNPIINKWNYSSSTESRLISLYNEGGNYTTRSPYAGRVPLYADVLGDWREEIFLNSSDNTEIRIFSTSTPASRRIYCLMQNPEYRMCINLKAYLPSTEVDFYLGQGMSNPPLPPVLEMKRQWKGGSNSNTWNINTTLNWLTSDTLDIYNDGDSVMFDITGTGNTSVQLAGDLSPSYIVINSPIDYTFGGTGKISGATKLLKSGKGILSISSNCDYTGVTKVDEGSLYVDSTLVNSAVNVNWHAAIGGKGKFNQQVTLSNGSIIVPGTATSVGTLTFNTGLTFPGDNTCMFDITDDSTGLTKPGDKIIVNGNFIISDIATFKMNKIDGTVKPGFYPLISYTGTFTGDLNKISISGLFGQKIALKDSISTIWLEVMASRGPGKVIWAGSGSEWDLLTSPNWLFKGISEIFANGDSVVFNEEGSGQYNVNLKGDLPISNMVVETDANSYYFSGTGNIGGTGGITKNGSGVLSIVNKTNTYTGKTVINNGTFIIGGLNNAGLASSIGASASTASSNIVFNNTKVQYMVGADTYTDRGVTITGMDTIEIGTSGKVLSLTGVLAGAGKLVKTGTGTLYITNNSNSYTGGTVIKSGTIQINDPGTTVNMLGSGAVTFEGGTLIMGNNQSSYTTSSMNFIVPAGFSGTLNTDARCNYTGTLTGSGILGIYLPGTIGRTVFMGNWSAFTGTVLCSGVQYSQCRLNNANGYSNIAFNLGINVTLTYQGSSNDASAQAVSIGALSGVAGSYLVDEAWTIGAKNTNSSYYGTISGYSVNKVGTGILTLTGANTYTGGTIISNGSLLVANTSGSATGTGSVTVNSPGVLTGTGIVSGAVVVNNGGTLAPGNMFGTLTVNNNVTLQAGSKWAVDVISSSGVCDKLSVNSTYKLKLNGGTLELTNYSVTPYEAGNSFSIVYASSISGTFSNIIPATPGVGLEWDTTAFRSTGIIRVAVEGTSSNKIIENNFAVNIYPNPSNGMFTIVTGSKKDVTISVENTEGICVYMQKYPVVQNEIGIDLTGRPEGVYIVKITASGRTTVKSVIKR